jgi:hypothetical protein
MKSSVRRRYCHRFALLLSAAATVLVGCGADGGESLLPKGGPSASTSGVAPAVTTDGELTNPTATTDGLGSTTPAASGATTPGATNSQATSASTQTSVTPPPFEPRSVMLRRLTRTQLHNVVKDVLGFEVDVHELDPDSWDGDFAAVGASKVVTSERGVEQYHQAIENAVNALFADTSTARDFIGCDPAEDAACTEGFVERIGRIAWRRPLLPEELTRVVGLAHTIGVDFEDPLQGVRWATTALFWSTNFIYRAELGTPGDGGALRYSGYEMASRLAFFLWNSAPDAALLDAASRGELDTQQGIRTAVLRMLEAPKGREVVGSFAEQYMRLDRLGLQAKDPSLFPEYNVQLRAAMLHDMRQVWQSVAFDDNGSVMDLFSTRRAFVNADLARVYGVDDGGLDANTYREIELPEDSPRIGILGKAAFLSQFANQKEGSPTLRGKFIRQSLMCMPVPAPPGNVDLVIDEAPPDMPMTKRERLALHRENESCKGCHVFMDPLGLPLETFDAIGRYRTTELGLTIDPSGEFDGTPVANARDLGLTVAESETVAQCMVRKFYSYAVGFQERAVDRTVVDELATTFRDSGYKLRELVLAIATHDAFASAAPQADFTVTSP